MRRFWLWIEDLPADQPPWGAVVDLDPVAGRWVVQGTRELPPGQGWIARLTIDATTGEIIERRFE